MDMPIDESSQPELMLESYMGNFDFSRIRHVLSSSDAQPLSLGEVLAMADDETKALWDDLVLRYTDNIGHPLLRQEVAKLHDVDADDVLVVCPQEGIFIAMNCLVRYIKRKHGVSSVHGVSIFPAFQALNDDLRLAGVTMGHWQAKFTAEEGWHFSLEELKALLTEETRILVVNFPHNPTGATLSTDQWRELTEICRSRDIFLFSDEMYRLTENDGSPPPPSACALYKNAITLFGMSKTLALPGLRIGWLCTRNKEMMEALKNYKNFTTQCAPGICEILALIALRNLDQILSRTRGLMTTNLGLWEALLAKHEDVFEWKKSSAGPVTLVRLKGRLAELGGATAFCENAIKDAGLFIIPGSYFRYGEDYIRIGFVREGMATALEEFDKYLVQLKQASSSSKTC